MSFQLPSSSRTSHTRPAWSGMALVVEAMLLLLVLVGSLAVVTQLFAAASTRAQSGRKLAQAVALATTEAERFAADPANAEGTFTEDDLTVLCTVTSETSETGTLYHASIDVRDTAAGRGDEEPIYTLTTTRYQREVR